MKREFTKAANAHQRRAVKDVKIPVSGAQPNAKPFHPLAFVLAEEILFVYTAAAPAFPTCNAINSINPNVN